MGRPPSVNNGRHSITGQAARRLFFSLGLFVVVVALSAVTLYDTALDKAAAERANDLRDFYQSRLTQLEREWEVQARDFRVRIEYTRLLEQPATAVLNLQAFMTIQGSDRRFQYLAVHGRDDAPLFQFGKTLRAPGPLPAGTRYYLDPQEGWLYRVFEEPVWLGDRGMGRMWVYFRIDHALLDQLAAPGVILRADYRGQPVASSLGPRGLAASAPKAEGEAQQRSVPWSGDDKDPLRLILRAPVKALFSTAELAAAAGIIPVLDGLILWFVLGTWLLRQTRRINALKQAVRESGTIHNRERMEQRLREASAGEEDEIAAVADTLRRTTAQREQAEQHIVSLNAKLQHHNAQLEAVNSELESFIYSVSHDLRSPLRTMSGYTSIIEEDYGARLDATGTGYLARIRTSAARMNQRIDDLLYLSRIARQELTRSEVDLSAMAVVQIAELRESQPERRLEAAIAPGLVAYADERLLGIALSNLIANAWKFTQHTEGARIEIGAGVYEGRTTYWVRDNGAGFDRALADRLFKPFHRLHPETEFEGSGLGLAIVERVVRRHGGHVWAEGAVGKGATFYFTL